LFRPLAATGTFAGVLALAVSGPAAAANAPGTGRPGQTCLNATAPSEPRNAASAPGSAFNQPDPVTGLGEGMAGGVYAGSQPQNSDNPNSVAQYDVACFQVSQH
jgi:hypothetical protein